MNTQTPNPILDALLGALNAHIDSRIQGAIGESITELFADRIESLIKEKMTDAIDVALDRHLINETHGADLDELAETLTDHYRFRQRIKGAVQDEVKEAIEEHCSEYDHDEVEDTPSEDRVEEMINEALENHTPKIDEEQIDERVREALKHLSVHVMWGDGN